MTRLTALELHGYKTFAGKWQFAFPAEITAVVGPNGSGKSNIADSLRWVLGEQSFGLLRGRKTEDMIFAGSEQRPKAGMAEATIRFNNENGWLPIDFSEVSITRRAYRDGQNEYLLNGQRVRLKEIYELLAQSGLGQRTYTIIGQGLVDAALSLKPEERRRFFEEAAGIGLYRSRREESLNRLETTRRNLERVHDIVAELEPRLESLEKQARRAIEYERIKADLQILLRDWYGYHWHRTQAELAHAREVLHAQESRLESTRSRVAGIDEKLDHERQSLQSMRENLNRWHAESAALHTRWEKASRSLAVLDERQRALEIQIQSLQGDLARSEEEHTLRKEKVTAAEAEAGRLQIELEDARQHTAQARKAADARQRERDQVEQEQRDIRRQLVSTETRKVQLSAHHTELQSRLDTLSRSRQTLTQTLGAEAQKVSAAQKAHEEANARREQAEQAAREAEAAARANRHQVSDLETLLRQKQDENHRLETERARLQAQLNVLEQAERSFTGLNQGARFVLESARQGKISGEFRSLNSLLEVPRELETAIASVLGEVLDSVLVEAETAPDSVLELLIASEKGRAVLIPTNFSQASMNLLESSDSGCLGNAARLVKVEGSHRRIVDALLGDVLVAVDRASARRLQASIPSGARVVTLKGEVFWGSGVVIAGQDNRSGIIARPRQKKELQDSLAALETQVVDSSSQLEKLRKQIEELRSVDQKLEQNLRHLNQELAQAGRESQKAALELDQARQRSEYQRSQQGSIESQIQKTTEEIKRLDIEIESAGGKIGAFQDQIRKINRQLGGLPMEDLQSQVVHWSTNAAVVERALRDADQRIKDHQRDLQANENQAREIQQRLANARQSHASIDSERSSLHTEESTLSAEIDTLQKQIDPAEISYQEIETRYNTILGDQSAARQALTVAERYAAQAQMDVTRQREALDSLHRRIEEDFGLVAFETAPTDVVNPVPLPLDGMVEQLPIVNELPAGLEENINRHRAQLRRMGAVNMEAQAEYKSVKERCDFLKLQIDDLKKADADLRQVISELDELMRKEFFKTFNAVAAEFRQLFTRLFGGGSARLVMVDDEDLNQAGVEIEARLPGRREQGLSLLSGGERSLTAVALVFALLKVSPTPFCVLDEVDAMLDEANVGRFVDLLRELSVNTQFIVITHNRNTVQAAGVIYGITMGRDSTSQVISLKLDEVSEDMAR